nr:hypothetical protein [Tanacetum cinerariifolium]
VDDDDDDDVEEEDDENEDVDIEEDDDAEIIFPYEVQGDQTQPPRDESSDSEFEAKEADDELEVGEASVEPKVEEAGVWPKVEEVGDAPEAEGADVELEAEEPDGTPEATIGTGSQRPFAALRRDLEALRRHEKIKEAESETSRTEIALLGSEAKIGKIERQILHHDLSGVEETLGKVVERLKMVHKGAVPKPPSDDKGSERPRKMPKKSDEDEGPSDPRGPLMSLKEDNDAEIIFPYEVQGDQTPPPRDESFDSDFEAEEADDELEAEEADDELEVEEAAEEPDGAPEATIGTGSQRSFVVRDFPMGFHEA